MRILGLDVGEKRIGVAISDPTGIIAQPLMTIERGGDDIERIVALIEEEEVGEVVVGLPFNMDGSLGEMGEKVKVFAGGLKARLDIPMVFIDERLSTREAERLMISADVSRRKRRKKIDRVSAAIILQGRLGGMKGTAG